jgi:hypothetical protein
MIKIVDDIKHVTGLPSGGINRLGRFVLRSKWGETLAMVQEGLLTRPQLKDGQQASIHIGIEAGVDKVGFQ